MSATSSNPFAGRFVLTSNDPTQALELAKQGILQGIAIKADGTDGFWSGNVKGVKEIMDAAKQYNFKVYVWASDTPAFAVAAANSMPFDGVILQAEGETQYANVMKALPTATKPVALMGNDTIFLSPNQTIRQIPKGVVAMPYVYTNANPNNTAAVAIWEAARSGATITVPILGTYAENGVRIPLIDYLNELKKLGVSVDQNIGMFSIEAMSAADRATLIDWAKKYPFATVATPPPAAGPGPAGPSPNPNQMPPPTTKKPIPKAAAATIEKQLTHQIMPSQPANQRVDDWWKDNKPASVAKPFPPSVVETFTKAESQATAVGPNLWTDNSSSMNTPKPYAGGTPVAHTSIAPNGTRTDITASGAVIQTAVGKTPYRAGWVPLGTSDLTNLRPGHTNPWNNRAPTDYGGSAWTPADRQSVPPPSNTPPAQIDLPPSPPPATPTDYGGSAWTPPDRVLSAPAPSVAAPPARPTAYGGSAWTPPDRELITPQPSVGTREPAIAAPPAPAPQDNLTAPAPAPTPPPADVVKPGDLASMLFDPNAPTNRVL